MTPELQKKVDFAINLLRAIPQDGEIEVSYSGGKDSDVILELAKMAGIPYRAIYKNTTIDPPGTIAHCKAKGVEVLAPKINFFDLVRREGSPSRWARFCCKYLKEYKVLDRAIQGIRKSESVKRALRYKEPEECRNYGKKQKVKVYLPILEWTDEDVAQFVDERGIKCHPLYYDEKGNFHVERRLGCMICPLMSQSKLRERYKQYPKFLKIMINAYQEYYDNHKATKSHERFRDAYDERFYSLFCKNMEDFKQKVTGGLFPETAIDPKKYMEDYFKIEL